MHLDLTYPESTALKLINFGQMLGHEVCKLLKNEDVFSKLDNILGIEENPIQEVDS